MQPSFPKHAVITKIPPSLCEETTVKTPNEMYDFMCGEDFIYKGVMWMGEKKWKRKGNERKILVWLSSHPPFYYMEANSFPVSENAENISDLPKV